MSDSTQAARLIRELGDAIADSQSDLENMPVFVRPMVKRGFARRTGLSFDDWRRLMTDLARLAGTGAALSRRHVATLRPDLEQLLERLADSYRTAPDRAARFMRNRDALERVRQSSAVRERAARAVLDWIRALPA